jgi:hypothetical protein
MNLARNKWADFEVTGDLSATQPKIFLSVPYAARPLCLFINSLPIGACLSAPICRLSTDHLFTDYAYQYPATDSPF